MSDAQPRISAKTRAMARRMRSTQTWTEAQLWKRLRALQVRVRRQAPIGPYVVDFACLKAKLLIEIDGAIHKLDVVAQRDLERDAWLSAQGYRVLRIDAVRIPADMDAILDEIASAIRLKVPLPLEGEGVRGWGDDATFNPNPSAFTPTQPSPLKGEGRDAS